MKKEYIIIIILAILLIFLFFRNPTIEEDFYKKVDSLEPDFKNNNDIIDSVKLKQDTVFVETFLRVDKIKYIKNETNNNLISSPVGIWSKFSAL